jgi:hypothetical protein
MSSVDHEHDFLQLYVKHVHLSIAEQLFQLFLCIFLKNVVQVTYIVSVGDLNL